MLGCLAAAPGLDREALYRPVAFARRSLVEPINGTEGVYRFPHLYGSSPAPMRHERCASTKGAKKPVKLVGPFSRTLPTNYTMPPLPQQAF